MSSINTIIGKYKGSNSKFEGKDITCDTLKENNDDNESLFQGGDKNGNSLTEKYCDRKRESHTFTTMFLKEAGEIFEAYSDIAGRPKWFKEGMIEGQSAADRTKKNPKTGEYDNTKLCEDSDFKYNGDPNMLGGHTEARFLTELAGLGSNPNSSLSGKKIVFNILWQNKNGEPPNAPCKDCFNMMCAATNCGAEIEVCDPNGEPQNIAEHCPNDYNDFLEKMKKVEEQGSGGNEFF